MKLYYYDDRTPKHYQPPLFKDCKDQDMEFNLPSNEELTRVNLGTASSSYHSMSVKIKTVSDALPTNDYGTASLKSNLPSQQLNSLSNLSAIGPYQPIFQFDTQKGDEINPRITMSPKSKTQEINMNPPADVMMQHEISSMIIEETKENELVNNLQKDDKVSCSCGCNEVRQYLFIL